MMDHKRNVYKYIIQISREKELYMHKKLNFALKKLSQTFEGNLDKILQNNLH